MKKNRIMELCLILVAIVAMTGTASASFNIQVGDGSLIKMKPGDSMTFDITLSGFLVNENLIPPLKPVTPDDPRDVEIYAYDVICMSPTCFGSSGLSSIEVIRSPLFSVNNDPFTKQGAVTFNMIDPNLDGIGTLYQVTLFGTDNTVDKIYIYEDPTGAGDIPVENIPEFPTVALPIAATIGLLFFFRHNKRKDEK